MRAYQGRAHADWEQAREAQRLRLLRASGENERRQTTPLSSRSGSWDRTAATIRSLPEVPADE